MTNEEIQAKKTRVNEQVQSSLKKRYAAEARFKAIGLGAIVLGLLFVSILFIDIVSKGYSAFVQTHVQLEVHFDPAVIDPSGNRDMQEIARADYRKLVRAPLRAHFPEVTSRRDKRQLYTLLSSGASYQLQ